MNLPSLFRNDNSLWNADPFRRMTQLQKEMDRFFEGAPLESSLPNAWASESFMPSCEVQETDDHYVVSMDIPGMRKEDINIELRGNQLLISGERREEKEENRKGRYRSERSYGSFERSFAIPEEVKAEQIETDYKDGVLHIAIPKLAATKAQQIKIGESKSGIFDRLLKRDQKAIGVKDSHRVA